MRAFSTTCEFGTDDLVTGRLPAPLRTGNPPVTNFRGAKKKLVDKIADEPYIAYKFSRSAVTTMPRSESLGQFEQAVLTAVLHLGDGAYGLAVYRKVCVLHEGQEVNLGAMYGSLERLEKKGYVSSRTETGAPERGGRARKYYTVEPIGEKALFETMGKAKRIYDMLWDSTWRSVTWVKEPTT